MSPVFSILIATVLFGTRYSLASPGRTIDLGGVPFTSVLDFEVPSSDRVYLKGKVKFEKWASFTGKYGVSIPAGQSVKLRLGAALVGREFPGRWKYLGFHTRSNGPARLRVRWREAGVSREALQVDIESITREWIELVQPAELEKLELELINESNQGTSIGIDDFILCDPELVVQKFQPDSIGLERSGLGWYIQTSEGRTYAGRWDPMSSAVNPVEWSPLRVVFTDARGRRFSFDSHGVRRPTGEAESLLEVQPLDDSARIDRNSSGDSDQDGYNQTLGSYQVHALMPTVVLRISPLDKPVEQAMLEIDSLPPGKIRVTMEGELVNRVHRLTDGHLLIELPITIDRAMEIEIRSIEMN